MTGSQAPRNRSPANSPAGDRVNVGFLHLGGVQNGINRYGRAVAAALSDMPGVAVVQLDRDMFAPGWPGIQKAVRAVRAFPTADVVVVPESQNQLWASGRVGLLQRLIIHLGLRCRTVSDMHDVYPPGGRRHAVWWASALTTLLPKAIVIHGEHERASLDGLPRAARAIVVPLIVESTTGPSRDEARATYGLNEDERVIVQVGWLHQRKNYTFSVDLLSQLDQRYRMWFVGGASEVNARYRDGVLSRAQELGVSDRLEVTGYVSDLEMASRLAATDVGLTPYRDASASASLSTLLGARCPVVSHDLPVARELAALAPGAVTIVPQLELGAWQRAVVAAASGNVSQDAYATIDADRAPGATAARYAAVLRRAAHPRIRRSA